MQFECIILQWRSVDKPVTVNHMYMYTYSTCMYSRESGSNMIQHASMTSMKLRKIGNFLF